jgi:demethylmenaquinone methyltransferase/2-methoxy-6-polyprenyl-1,4-benzoquinol methylase
MERDADLVHYYGARAAEYEKVYATPERQDDLRVLHDLVAAFSRDRSVLELACGTGYWTRIMGPRAAALTAFDLSPEVLALARARQPSGVVDFRVGDAFDPPPFPVHVDAAFAGFWWSHVRRRDIGDFLRGLHDRLPSGSPVMFIDNRYVAESNRPLSRTDDDGNSYQRRRLENGTEHEVLKNFPDPEEVRSAIQEAGGETVQVTELTYYWYASYVTSPGRIPFET